MNKQHAQAIVIGGSMAGLLAARALSDHFDQVTLLDRDQFPTTPALRSGVPQAKHVHILLLRGATILEDYFPGFHAELVAAGVPEVDFGMESEYFGYLSSGRAKQGNVPWIKSLTPSRALLEHHIRQRVIALPNVKVIDQVDVEGLLTNPDQSVITGVTLKSRKDHQHSALFADLIVDCSGRNSKAPEWLEALGYQKPTETLVNSHVGYATRWYEGAPPTGHKCIIIQSDPSSGIYRGGGLLAVEGNQFVLTLAGVNQDYPPTEEDAFLEFAQTLLHPILYETIKASKPITPISGYRYQGSRRRHYEQLDRLPGRFILMGDSILSFNPIYGQGMSVAAMESEVLAKLLKEAPHLDGNFVKRFQKGVHDVAQDAWLLATGEDLRSPLVEGSKPNWMDRLNQQFSLAVLRMASSDADFATTFFKVAHLVERPTALMRPDRVLRLIAYQVTGRGVTKRVEKRATQVQSAVSG
jgi:2-polyprenyl-6-methoxyphenol hydroxylase-like FAD-dependent oxidoreductase